MKIKHKVTLRIPGRNNNHNKCFVFFEINTTTARKLYKGFNTLAKQIILANGAATWRFGFLIISIYISDIQHDTKNTNINAVIWQK